MSRRSTRDDDIGRERLSLFFNLSYANYLTAPRSLLEELDERFQWPLANDVRIEVRLRDAAGRYVTDPLAEYRRPDVDAIARAQEALRAHDRRGAPRLDVGTPLHPEDVPGRNV